MELQTASSLGKLCHLAAAQPWRSPGATSRRPGPAAVPPGEGPFLASTRGVPAGPGSHLRAPGPGGPCVPNPFHLHLSKPSPRGQFP